jgi:hypothetical protein
MAYYNPVIGARSGNACHPARPFGNWELDRLLRFHRKHSDTVIYAQGGTAVILSKRRIRINGKLVSAPQDKRQRSKFVELLTSGMSWYRAIDAIASLIPDVEAVSN